MRTAATVLALGAVLAGMTACSSSSSIAVDISGDVTITITDTTNLCTALPADTLSKIVGKPVPNPYPRPNGPDGSKGCSYGVGNTSIQVTGTTGDQAASQYDSDVHSSQAQGFTNAELNGVGDRATISTLSEGPTPETQVTVLYGDTYLAVLTPYPISSNQAKQILAALITGLETQAGGAVPA